MQCLILDFFLNTFPCVCADGKAMGLRIECIRYLLHALRVFACELLLRLIKIICSNGRHRTTRWRGGQWHHSATSALSPRFYCTGYQLQASEVQKTHWAKSAKTRYMYLWYLVKTQNDLSLLALLEWHFMNHSVHYWNQTCLNYFKCNLSFSNRRQQLRDLVANIRSWRIFYSKSALQCSITVLVGLMLSGPLGLI